MFMQNLDIRNTAPWKMLNHLLKNERYTNMLMYSLLNLGPLVKMTPVESAAFHGGYDHMILFSVLGFALKAEDTEATKTVTDILYRHRVQIRPYLNLEVTTLLDSAL